MGEVLSQKEIDALLESLSSGQANEIKEESATEKKRIVAYNFARPSKFGKEQLRTLEIVFESFSRLVSSFLSGYLRVSTQIEVESAQQLIYSEFNNSLINPVVLGIIDFKPMKGSIIIELASNIGYTIIDRVLGGIGQPLKKTREFTEIEKILLERILSQLVSFLVEPWSNVCEIMPKLDKLETNSQFAQIVSPNEMIALVTLSIKIGNVSGLINFCIPHLTVEPIMGNLNTKHWFTVSESENTDEYKISVEKQLETAKVPISAVVGRTMITVDDFINLQVGDVIPLDSYVNSDFKVMVGNILKFYAKPGLSHGKNAIQITSIIRKED